MTGMHIWNDSNLSLTLFALNACSEWEGKTLTGVQLWDDSNVALGLFLIRD